MEIINIDLTPFEQAVAAGQNGTLKAPVITIGGTQVNPLRFQVVQHKAMLRMAAANIKVRGFRLKDIKAYYGYKGRSAAEVLKEHLSLMESYGI